MLLSRPMLLTGTVWLGGDSEPFPDGAVLVGTDGLLLAAGPRGSVAGPGDALAIAVSWIGPGLIDAHVHLAFGSPDAMLAGGVVACRDLGAPPADAARWARTRAPVVAVAGPVLTAPGGYPSRSWGARGFAAFLDDPAQAEALVAGLAAAGVGVVKLALEPAGGPVPDLALARIVTEAAHARGLAVTAHALRADMVSRALDAGVDELAHIPLDVLPAELVARLAGPPATPVVSTLATLVGSGPPQVGAGIRANAAALVGAGVPLRYGSDLGNHGTQPGADLRELRLLADAGLGARGALRAATDGAAAAPGLAGRVTGRLTVGAPVALVGLDADPVRDPGSWRRPRVVCVGAQALLPAQRRVRPTLLRRR